MKSGLERNWEEAFRVYTKEGCTYCDQAKALLDKLGLLYAEFDVADEYNKAFIKGQGFKTVPQIWLGDQHIGGFDKLQGYLNGDKS